MRSSPTDTIRFGVSPETPCPASKSVAVGSTVLATAEPGATSAAPGRAARAAAMDMILGTLRGILLPPLFGRPPLSSGQDGAPTTTACRSGTKCQEKGESSALLPLHTGGEEGLGEFRRDLPFGARKSCRSQVATGPMERGDGRLAAKGGGWHRGHRWQPFSDLGCAYRSIGLSGGDH